MSFQPIALELFAADGRNYLLVFVRKERNKVYHRLLNSATELTDSAIHSVSGQRRSINIEQGYNLLFIYSLNTPKREKKIIKYKFLLVIFEIEDNCKKTIFSFFTMHEGNLTSYHTDKLITCV